MQLSLLCSSTSQDGSYNMALEVLRRLRMVKFCSSRAPWHHQQVQRDCNQMKQQKLSTAVVPIVPVLQIQSSLPFLSFLHSVRKVSMKSTVQCPMFKLKKSDSISKCLPMFTQHTTICKSAPGMQTTHETFVQNESLGPLCWCSMARATASASLFVCIFCQKKNVRKQQSYLLPWPILWRYSEFCMPANNSFAFPSCLPMPASNCYCIQLKPWLAQNLWKKRGTVAVRYNYTYLAIFIHGDSVRKKGVWKYILRTSICI